jgi:hypothetical protein
MRCRRVAPPSKLHGREPSSVIRRCSGFGLLLAASGAFAGPPPAACTPEVIGTWKLESSTLPQTTLLRFGRDGWASLLSGPSDQPAESYETIAQVSYVFAPTRSPRRLEFSTRRGNDVFAAGTSRWEIIAHSDYSLTTRAADAAGESMSWSRIPTQRYFLTLTSRPRTAQRPTMADVVWTTLGSTSELEALGATGARFGRIPGTEARELAWQSSQADAAMLRIELNEAEYQRTHRVLEAWDAVLKNASWKDEQARSDVTAQLTELFDATVQSVNRCALRVQLPTAPARFGNPHQWLQAVRRLNDKRHVSDRLFPSGWKPPAVG